MEKGCTRLPERDRDTMVMIIFVIPRNAAHLEQRVAQRDNLVYYHRLNIGKCLDTGADLPPWVTPAANIKSHTSEACMHTDVRDHFGKDLPSSNALWLQTKGGRLSSRESHLTLVVIITGVERGAKGQNTTLKVAYES